MCASISDRARITGNIHIVLAGPQVPENIGLCARVLKNTSFSSLRLVTPALTKVSFNVAKRARDILENARTFQTLEAAVSDASFVVGTTRRKRADTPVVNFKDSIPLLISQARRAKVCIVFGKENFGLSSRECGLCDVLVYISADTHFPSYNLATACGIFCYTLFEYLTTLYSPDGLSLARKKDIDSLFSYSKRALERLPLKEKIRSSAGDSLRRIIRRTLLTKNEVQLIKSILAAAGVLGKKNR